MALLHKQNATLDLGPGISNVRAMEITLQDIETFKGLYEKEFGETLSAEAAKDKLQRLRRLYEILYLAPMPREHIEALQACCRGSNPDSG